MCVLWQKKQSHYLFVYLLMASVNDCSLTSHYTTEVMRYCSAKMGCGGGGWVADLEI